MLGDYQRALRASLACAAVLVLAGCAMQKELGEESRAALIERVESRWAALESDDYDTAYTFMSPAYRDVYTLEMYKRQFLPTLERKLTSVEILNYDARAAVASVAVGVMSRSTRPTSAASQAIGAITRKSTEMWVRRNNVWWFSVIK